MAHNSIIVHLKISRLFSLVNRHFVNSVVKSVHGKIFSLAFDLTIITKDTHFFLGKRLLEFTENILINLKN